MITCSTDKDDNILIMQIYDKEYRIAQLLAKEITGTLSLEEREELEIWRNENHSTQELYKQILDPQNRSQRDQFVKELNLEKSWKHVQQQIIPKYSHIKHSLTWISGIVASILIIIGVSLVLFNAPKSDQVSKIIAGIHSGSPKAIFITPEGKQIHLTPQDTIQTLKLENGLIAINQGNTFEYSGSDNQPLNINKFNTIQVPRGGEYELILPDSTHVWINSDSELSFPVHFNKENREVILSGEAYFAVAKKMKQPFIVKTKDEIEIKVLGTQFNVRAYPEARTIETTLNQGAVKISSKQQSVELKPNQQLAKAILEQYQPKSVEEMQDALKDIFGPMFEAMLQGEMNSHLGYSNNERGEKETVNRRNGYTKKTLKTTVGDVPIEVPRDREGTF